MGVVTKSCYVSFIAPKGVMLASLGSARLQSGRLFRSHLSPTTVAAKQDLGKISKSDSGDKHHALIHYDLTRYSGCHVLPGILYCVFDLFSQIRGGSTVQFSYPFGDVGSPKVVFCVRTQLHSFGKFTLTDEPVNCGPREP